MNEQDLHRLVGEVKTGRLSRRGFIQRMAALGLAAPMATQLLALAGVRPGPDPADDLQADQARRRRPAEDAVLAGRDAAATRISPSGTKDQDGSRIFYEPLAGWATDGTLVPVLAAEIPSIENGGLAADGTSVTWKLKRGVKWHDGQPFTADDVVFNWEYAKDPATASVTIGSYRDVVVTKVDDHTVRVEFEKPTPFWADAFVGSPRHDHPEAPVQGLHGRQVARRADQPEAGRHRPLQVHRLQARRHRARRPERRTTTWPNRPYFDAIEMKGGGDAVSAARAVLQTGEYDYAWNLQVEDEILKRLEAGGKGKVNVVETGNIEFIQLNTTDPNQEVDGERSSIKTKHPTFSDPAVREAMDAAGRPQARGGLHLRPHRRRPRRTS